MDKGLCINFFSNGKHIFTYKVDHSMTPSKWIEEAKKSAEESLKDVQLEYTESERHPNDLEWMKNDFSLRLDVKMIRCFEFKKVQEKMTFCKLEDWGNFRDGMLVQKIEHSESFEYFGKNQIT